MGIGLEMVHKPEVVSERILLSDSPGLPKNP